MRLMWDHSISQEQSEDFVLWTEVSTFTTDTPHENEKKKRICWPNIKARYHKKYYNTWRKQEFHPKEGKEHHTSAVASP